MHLSPSPKKTIYQDYRCRCEGSIDENVSGEYARNAGVGDNVSRVDRGFSHIFE